MKITADTNILLRDVLHNNPHQWPLAKRTLRKAELVAVPLSVLCEFVWGLRRGYKKRDSEVANSVRALIGSANVVTNYAAVEAGLAILEAGGDFADGATAHEGAWLGAEEFVSFDKNAVDLLKSQGVRVRLLA